MKILGMNWKGYVSLLALVSMAGLGGHFVRQAKAAEAKAIAENRVAAAAFNEQLEELAPEIMAQAEAKNPERVGEVTAMRVALNAVPAEVVAAQDDWVDIVYIGHGPDPSWPGGPVWDLFRVEEGPFKGRVLRCTEPGKCRAGQARLVFDRAWQPRQGECQIMIECPGCVPIDATLTPKPISSSTFTPTPVNTATFTPTPINTATWTPTPISSSTFTPTPVNTATFTPTPIIISTATFTPIPTGAATATPTTGATATVDPSLCMAESAWPKSREDAAAMWGGTRDDWEMTSSGAWHRLEAVGPNIPSTYCLIEGFLDRPDFSVWAAFTSLDPMKLGIMVANWVGSRWAETSFGFTIHNTTSADLARYVHCEQWKYIQDNWSPETRRHWELHAFGFEPEACVPFPTTPEEAAALFGQPGERSGEPSNWSLLPDGQWKLADGLPRSTIYIPSWLVGEGWVDPHSLPRRRGWWMDKVIGATIGMR